MSLSEHENRYSSQLERVNTVFTLVLNEQSSLGVSDKPIFGTTVTIRDDIESLIGYVLQAGTILGWLNFVDVDKFACISNDRHFTETNQFFYAKSNQFVLLKPIVIHEVFSDMQSAKQIFSFSHIESNVHNIRTH